MGTLMTLKFPDPDRPPPSDPAIMQVYYSGDLDAKKDTAVVELLREYDAKQIKVWDSTDKRTFTYAIARRYLVHAANKLKRANFLVIEGSEHGAIGPG